TRRSSDLRSAASLMDEIPERPQQDDTPQQPERKCEVGKSTGLDLWAIAQDSQGDVHGNQSRGNEEEDERFESSHPPVRESPCSSKGMILFPGVRIHADSKWSRHTRAGRCSLFIT